MSEDRQTCLIIDIDSLSARKLGDLIQQIGIHARTAANLDQARESLQSSSADLILIGQLENGDRHPSALRSLAETVPGARFIVLTSNQNPQDEETWRQAGLTEFLARDLPPGQFLRCLQLYGDVNRLEARNRRFRRILEGRTCFENLLGGSAPMRALYRLIEQIARADAPVLITGEEGSELIETATSIHLHGSRAAHPLITVDCLAFPPGQLEQEVFGARGIGQYAAGPSPRGSAFARAGAGAVLFHHIEAIDESLQLRLLEFFHSPFFQGETSSTPQPIARIIATASDGLQSEVDEGRFSRELYYRLNILHVRIPPLRQRREDIPMLAEHFLQSLDSNGGKHRPPMTFTNDAMAHLFQYAWPGNLEELAATVREAADQCPAHSIDIEHLPPRLVESIQPESAPNTLTSARIPLKQAKHQFETEYFHNLLTRTGGNMTLASRLSKVGRPYLYKKIRECGLDPDAFRRAA